MAVQCDEDTLLGNGMGQDFCVVSPAQSKLGGPRHVVAFGAEARGQFHSEHLIQEQAHDRSGRRQFPDL
jgi:hypothetical protein